MTRAKLPDPRAHIGTSGDGGEHDPGRDELDDLERERGDFDPEPPEDDQEDQEEPPEDIEDLLAFLGTEADAVRLYRLNERGDREYLERVAAGSFGYERVKERHGAGKYEAQVVGKGNKFKGSRRFQVAGKEEPPEDQEAPHPGAGQGPTRVFRDPELERPPETIREAVQRLEWMMRDLRNPPAAAQQADPAQMAVALATHMHQATQPFMSAFLELMKENKKDHGAEEFTAMRAFMEGAEFMREVAGGRSEGGSGLSGLADTILAPLVKRLAETPSYPTGAGGAGPAPGAPNPPTADPEARTAPRWAQDIAPWVAYLTPISRRGGDPGLYAELAYDQLSAQDWTRLMTEIKRGESFEREFFGYFPDTAASQPWFRQLFETFREIDQETGDGEASDVSSGGGGGSGRAGGAADGPDGGASVRD